MGDLVEKANIPVGKAHVEVKVPPGLYIVWGKSCDPGKNRYTDKAMVAVGCHQELCVDLLLPSVRTCVARDLEAFVVQARFLDLPEPQITELAHTMMAVGGIPPGRMIEEFETSIQEIEKSKGPVERVEEYRAILNILHGP